MTTKTLTRIGNGTILRLALPTAMEDPLSQMRAMVVVDMVVVDMVVVDMAVVDMVVVDMAIIPTLVHTAAMDGPHSPRTMIIEIRMRTISSLLHSAIIEDIRFPAAMSNLPCTGTSLDHLFPATTVGAIRPQGTMDLNYPIPAAVATDQATHTQIATTKSDKEVLITTPTTAILPMAHRETADPPTRIRTIARECTEAAAGTAVTDAP